MSDPLPADVREYLERAAVVIMPDPEPAKLLERYPKPAPAWQPGDVVLMYDGEVVTRLDNGKWSGANAVIHSDADLGGDAELIVRDGKRVHPARFHAHAEALRQFADELGEGFSLNASGLRAIADDIDPETTPAPLRQAHAGG